jgi:outer membrane lipoprotein carrier protein
MKNRAVVLLWIIGMLIHSNVIADMSANAIAQKVQSLYDRTSTMEADFVQIASMKSLSISEQDHGIVYMKKDGKIRWDYKSPKKQLIVSNGKTIWFYMPSDNQVIIGSFEKSFKYKPTQTFLTGMGRILEDFDVRFGNSKELPVTSNEYLLELIPKKHSEESPAKILLAVNKKDFLIVKSAIVDRFGNITEIDFKNIKLNATLPDDLFTFTPPENVEIIHSPGQ